MTRNSAMKIIHSSLSSSQLLQMLTGALRKEHKLFTSATRKGIINDNMEVKPEQRDEMVKWLIKLNEKFQYCPETFALSVCILDRFLNSVKVQPKYLICTTVSCFYLAAKTLEEDEEVPTTREFIQESRCGCSIAEVLRMEKIILDKLNWDLMAITSVDFLHILHALLLSACPQLLESTGMTGSQQVNILMKKLKMCLANHHLLLDRPSTIALALISLELELFRRDWLVMVVDLQKQVKVDNPELIRCRELISRYMESSDYIKLYHVHEKSVKRKVGHLEDDSIYDYIKRMYSEEPLVVDDVTVAADVTETSSPITDVRAN